MQLASEPQVASSFTDVLSLRPMNVNDLPAVEGWLRLPHVARWWTPNGTPEQSVAKYRQRITTDSPQTIMLMATWDSVPIGWCQWYRWADHPADATAMLARDSEIGIDYAIGDIAWVGRGTGTMLIAALVDEVRRHNPGAGILTAPDAVNIASRRVLEKNGFGLVAVRPVASEPTDTPMAIYRLAAVELPLRPTAKEIRLVSAQVSEHAAQRLVAVSVSVRESLRFPEAPGTQRARAGYGDLPLFRRGESRVTRNSTACVDVEDGSHAGLAAVVAVNCPHLAGDVRPCGVVPRRTTALLLAAPLGACSCSVLLVAAIPRNAAAMSRLAKRPQSGWP
jgi:RimJ/RimL family protein N-acetyltransferase